MRKKLLQHTKIKNADIKFTLPNRLDFALYERHPYAAWFHAGKLSLIDKEGYIFSHNVDFSTLDNKYVIASGDGANKKLEALLDELESHNIYNELFAVELISNRRWNLLTKDDTLVKLPETEHI